MQKKFIVPMLLLAFPLLACANCFHEAARTYDMPESLLRAIAQVETGGRDLPPSLNANGSWDIGVMRINSGWLPQLRRYGITAAALSEPCQNIHVGAWILAANRQRYGAGWTAVGAYNVGCLALDKGECERRRAIYNAKVYCVLNGGVASACAPARGSRRKP